MKFVNSLIAAALTLALTGTAALAQAAAPAAAAPAAPGRPDVKTVGDWMVRCFPIQNPSPCDVYQELDDQRTRQRVLSISLAYVPSLDKHGIQITVPLEVSIPKGLVIKTDSYTSPAFKYRMCDRSGCFVQTAVDNAAIDAIARSGPDAQMVIYADNGKQYNLRFSLKGFAAAHDSMVEQARAKAKPIPKAADQAAAPAPADGATP